MQEDRPISYDSFAQLFTHLWYITLRTRRALEELAKKVKQREETVEAMKGRLYGELANLQKEEALLEERIRLESHKVQAEQGERRA